jgi:hypothetical protein
LSSGSGAVVDGEASACELTSGSGEGARNNKVIATLEPPTDGSV